MKHVFLINPRAGKGDRAARLQAMAKRLAAQLGYEVAACNEAGDVYCVSEKVVYYGNDLSFYLSTFFMSCL